MVDHRKCLIEHGHLFRSEHKRAQIHMGNVYKGKVCVQESPFYGEWLQQLPVWRWTVVRTQLRAVSVGRL